MGTEGAPPWQTRPWPTASPSRASMPLHAAGRVGRRPGRAARSRPATADRTSSPPPARWAAAERGCRPLSRGDRAACRERPRGVGGRPRRQLLIARGRRRATTPDACARARTPVPTAPAARSRPSRRQPPTARRRPAPPRHFPGIRRPFARKRSAELAHEHQHQHQHQHEAMARTDAPESVTSDDDSLRPSSAFAVDADPRCLVLWAAPLSACSP